MLHDCILNLSRCKLFTTCSSQRTTQIILFASYFSLIIYTICDLLLAPLLLPRRQTNKMKQNKTNKRKRKKTPFILTCKSFHRLALPGHSFLAVASSSLYQHYLPDFPACSTIFTLYPSLFSPFITYAIKPLLYTPLNSTWSFLSWCPVVTAL